MTINTTNLSLKKAQDSDNAEDYFTVQLAGSLDTIDAIGTWQALSPGLAQGSAVAATVNYAQYTQIGKTMIMAMQLTPSASGTASNDILISNLPGNPVWPASVVTVVGHFKYVGSSGTVKHTGEVIMYTTGGIKFQVDNSNGFLGSAPAVTLANGDTISISMMFQVA